MIVSSIFALALAASQSAEAAAHIEPAYTMSINALPAASGPGREPVETEAWPELSRDVLLPQILADLKRTLKDPYSIRDLVVCPAGKIKMKDGRPGRWVVTLSLNAKNGFGGYTGIQTYAAAFRNGRLDGGVVSTVMPGSGAIEGFINSAIARKQATCPTIPDAEAQRLMGADSSIIR